MPANNVHLSLLLLRNSIYKSLYQNLRVSIIFTVKDEIIIIIIIIIIMETCILFSKHSSHTVHNRHSISTEDKQKVIVTHTVVILILIVSLV